MRRRRSDNRRLAAPAARIAGSLGFWLWARASRRPLDASAILIAAVASVVILVNALFLQSGSHSAPYLANPAPAPAAPSARAQTRQVDAAPPSPSHSAAAPWSTPVARRNDPIADLIATLSRIIALQRALSNYGYGQIGPTGIVDAPTSAAIGKFERDHKLPVTGQMSNRLMNELAVMVGHPL